MNDGERRTHTFQVDNSSIATWFMSLEMHEQDEWIQDVVGNDTARVSGFGYNPEDGLEIEYVTLEWVNEPYE